MNAKWLKQNLKIPAGATKALMASMLSLGVSSFPDHKKYAPIPNTSLDRTSVRHGLELPEYKDSDDFTPDFDIKSLFPDGAPEHVKAFRVEDNLMSPVFYTNEIVLADLSDTHPRPEGAFAISDGTNVLLRYCEFSDINDRSKIRISAPAETFEPQDLDLQQITILGRVIAKMRRVT